MLMIRFQRIGRTNDAAFRIVLLEKERAAKTGRITDRLGTYNPHTKAMTLDVARAQEWMKKGAQPTDTVRNLFITKGVLTGKKVNVLPKKSPPKKAEEAPAPAAKAAAPAEVAAPAATVAEAALPAEEEIAPVVEEAAPAAA